jgi:hypothetical protein
MRTLKPLIALVPLIAATWLTGCGAADDTAASENPETTEQAGYDMALLDEYRAALPADESVTAAVPGQATSDNALTMLGDAELAKLAIKSAVDINLPARLMVRILRAVTQLPPSLYDSKKKEFVWGPWDNEDGYGQVLVYIKENPKTDDFKYSYAFIRMVDSDTATMAPVIWGGGTPGPKKERGVGVTLWDFEANTAFDTEHDPDFDPDAARDAGRFAMVYGKGVETDGEFAFNVAVFRNFIGKDAEPGAMPADLDYFFGHFEGNDGNVFDFVDWSLTGNLCDAEPASCFAQPGAGQDEVLGLRAAFFNRGQGRAEAVVAGGDLSSSVSTVECWDADIDRTGITVSDDVAMLVQEGECAAPFTDTLDALGVPSLADVDAEMLAKMDCVATNGLAACEDK